MSADLKRCCRALEQDRCQRHRLPLRVAFGRPSPSTISAESRAADQPRGYGVALYIRQCGRSGSVPRLFNGYSSPDSVRGGRWWTAAPHVRRRNLVVKSSAPVNDPRLIGDDSHSSPDAIYCGCFRLVCPERTSACLNAPAFGMVAGYRSQAIPWLVVRGWYPTIGRF